MGSFIGSSLGGGLLAPPPLPSLNPIAGLKSQLNWAENDVKQVTGAQQETIGSAMKQQESPFDQPIKQLLGS